MNKVYQFSYALAVATLIPLSCVYAQQLTVSGSVHGLSGRLSGATVSIDTITTVTNKFGDFSLPLAAGSYILSITHAGYTKSVQEITIKDRSISLAIVMAPNEELDEVTVVGSRFASEGSNLQAPVPIDVVSSRRLFASGQSSLTQMLQFTLPSVNASRQLVNEPITLRGLDPDQLLILVNGKRFHNMSFLNWGGVRGILGRGSVSNDVNAIPFSAIQRIEVLRDGASAQYGSDAIAGVINIQLNNSIDKFRMQVHTGQTYKADGETVNAGLNYGTVLLKKGFLNLSAAFRFQNPTRRGGEYTGTVYVADSIADDAIVKSRNFNRKQVSNAGSSDHESYSLSANGGYPLNTKAELFWTAIFNHRRTTFTSGYILPKNAGRVNIELFPDGFKAQPINSVNDIAGIMGIKGETKNDWRWEFSSAYGNNSARYYNEHTNNASQYYLLGKNAPTSFYTGSSLYGQLTNNMQFLKTLHLTTNKLVNLALGSEWRFEHYQIRQGEEASWQTYNNPLRKFGGSGGLVLSPDDAVSANRHIGATYADAEFEINEHLLIGTAARFEYYNDFGSTVAGKITARYKFNEKILLRSSVNNGFRAPSLQQRYYSHTRSNPSSSGSTFNLVNSGIFRNNGKVAKALGISPLEPERSLNVSGGFTTSLHPNIKLTVDAYWIQIKNRIVLSGVFDRTTNKNVGELLGNITDVREVQVFANAINTRTKGLDAVLDGTWRMGKTKLTAMLGANFTQTGLFGEIQKAGNLKSDSLNTNTLFGNEEKTRIEKGQPSNKVILSLTYQIAKAEIRIHNTRFGKTAIAPGVLYQTFSSKILTDISVAYPLRNWVTVSLGANNIFNVYPDPLNDYRNTSEGMHIYSMEASPFGFNGGYYFMSMTLCLK